MNQAEMALAFVLILILPFALRTAYRAYLARWGGEERQPDWNLGDRAGFMILGVVVAVLCVAILILT